MLGETDPVSANKHFDLVNNYYKPTATHYTSVFGTAFDLYSLCISLDLCLKVIAWILDMPWVLVTMWR